MAKFRYRMQNILDVKEKLKTQAENEFAIAAANVAEEEEILEGLYKRKTEYEEYLTEIQKGNLDFRTIKETAQAIESMKYLIENQKQALAKAEQVLEIRRVALAEAMQEVKTHEKLKEKQFQQFMADEAAKESKEIDELVSFRFGNGGSSGNG